MMVVTIASLKMQTGKCEIRDLKGKVAPPGIEPRASGLSRQCSATELRCPDGNHPPSKPLLAYFKRLLEIRVVLVACIESDSNWIN